MTIEAELPDGTILEFPDGTDQGVIQSVVKNQLQIGSEEDARSEALINDPTSLIPGFDQSIDTVEQQPTTIGEDIVGAGEAALTLATGATGGTLGLAGGFLKGIVDELKAGKFGTNEAAKRIENAAFEASEALTFAPRTRSGQEQVEFIGSVAQQAGPLAGLAGEVGAITSATKGIKPGARLLTDSGAPTNALEAALNKKGLVFENLSEQGKASIPKVATENLIPGSSNIKSVAENVLVKEIQSGSRENALAVLKVKGGKAIPDKEGIEAIRQGFDEGFVQAAKTASTETRAGMKQQLNIMKRIKSNQRLALDIRPTDVVGTAMTKRIEFIRDKANKARTELNKIARVTLNKLDIDPDPVVNRLQSVFDKLDISVDIGPNGVPKPIYKGSLISKDRTSQRVITDLIDLMSEGGRPDALRFHKLKRQLDNMIDFRKKSVSGLSKAGKDALKDIRSTLNESIRAVSPDYARVNDVLSKSLTALDDFQNVAGSSIDIFGAGSSKAIGQDLRGLMSNRKSRIRLENTVDNINGVVSDLGGVFKDDIKDLSLFARSIEDRFGAVAKSSLTGEVESVVKRAGTQGTKAAAADVVLGAVGKGADKLRGINDFNAFKAMADLLNR